MKGISPPQKTNLTDQFLRQFKNGIKTLPKFENEQEEKIFLQLQKYNLIYVTPEGIFKLTKKGEGALKNDVEKYISFARLEERLIKDSFKKSSDEKIILFAVLPFILLMVIALITIFLL